MSILKMFTTAHLPDLRGKLILLAAAIVVIFTGIWLTVYFGKIIFLQISGYIFTALSLSFGVYWGGLSARTLQSWITQWTDDAELSAQLSSVEYPDGLKRLAPPIDEAVFYKMIEYSGMSPRELKTHYDFWEALIFLEKNPPYFDLLLRKLKDRVRRYTLPLTIGSLCISIFANSIYPLTTSSSDDSKQGAGGNFTTTRTLS